MSHILAIWWLLHSSGCGLITFKSLSAHRWWYGLVVYLFAHFKSQKVSIFILDDSFLLLQPEVKGNRPCTLRLEEQLGRTDTNTDSYMDTGYDIYEKNENTDMKRTPKKIINISIYYSIVNIIILINLTSFLYKGKFRHQQNVYLSLTFYTQRDKKKKWW